MTHYSGITVEEHQDVGLSRFMRVGELAGKAFLCCDSERGDVAKRRIDGLCPVVRRLTGFLGNIPGCLYDEGVITPYYFSIYT